MPIDIKKVGGATLPDTRGEWNDKDVILYALGVGVGSGQPAPAPAGLR